MNEVIAVSPFDAQAHAVDPLLVPKLRLGTGGNADNAVVLDIQMPIMDGLTVLKTLRKGEQTRNIPVIMLSASKDIADITLAKTAGAQDYISKPFIAEAMLSRCLKILNNDI